MKITVTSTTKTGVDLKGRVYTVEAVDIEARYSGDFKVVVEDGKARVFRLEEPGHYADGAWQVKPVSIFGEPKVETASDFENQAVAKILAMPLLTDKNRIEDLLERAAEKDPAIRDLLDYQVAYKRAVKRVQAGGDYADVMVYQACTAAIRAHCVMIAERSGNAEFAKKLRTADGISWHSAIYMLADRIPAVDDLIKKHLL